MFYELKCKDISVELGSDGFATIRREGLVTQQAFVPTLSIPTAAQLDTMPNDAVYALLIALWDEYAENLVV